MSGLPVSDWKDAESPKFRGRPIALQPHEIRIRWRSGRTGRFRAWLPNGRCAHSTPQASKGGGSDVPSIAWASISARDGEVLVVAYDDGTIRWLRWSDGKELLAFFVDAPTRKWVAWTPTGYYMASPGRRGSDRLAYKSRLGAARGFLSRLALLRALQPARHRQAGVEDPRRGGGDPAGQRNGKAEAGRGADRRRAAAGRDDRLAAIGR